MAEFARILLIPSPYPTLAPILVIASTSGNPLDVYNPTAGCAENSVLELSNQGESTGSAFTQTLPCGQRNLYKEHRGCQGVLPGVVFSSQCKLTVHSDVEM